MTVSIVFGKILEDVDQDKYVTDKLSVFFKDIKAAKENYNVVTRRARSIELPLAPGQDFYSSISQNRTEITKMFDLFTKEMDEYFVLDSDEEIINDFVSYLKNDFIEFKQGTVVLRRTTNKATLYYINSQRCFVNNRFEIISYFPHKLMIWELAIQAVLFLVKSLVAGGMSNIGSQLVNQLIGNNSIDFKKLELVVSKVVRDANIEQTVTEQDGVIKSIISDFQVYYDSRKKSGAPKSELYPWLVDKESKLNTSLSILEEPLFQEKGISSYTAGMSCMFCILQEMAFQDPNVSDYKQSSNVNVLINDINRAIEHISVVKPQILNKRLSQVNNIGKYNKCSYAGGYPVCSTHYYYEDNFDGKRYGDTSSYSEVQQSRSALIQSIIDSISWVDQVNEEWKKLSKNPINV